MEGKNFEDPVVDLEAPLDESKESDSPTDNNAGPGVAADGEKKDEFYCVRVPTNTTGAAGENHSYVPIFPAASVPKDDRDDFPFCRPLIELAPHEQALHDLERLSKLSSQGTKLVSINDLGLLVSNFAEFLSNKFVIMNGFQAFNIFLKDPYRASQLLDISFVLHLESAFKTYKKIGGVVAIVAKVIATLLDHTRKPATSPHADQPTVNASQQSFRTDEHQKDYETRLLSAVLKTSIPEQLTAALFSYQRSPRLIRVCVVCISRLAVYEEARISLAKYGIGVALLSLLRQDGYEKFDIRYAILMALRNLSAGSNDVGHHLLIHSASETLRDVMFNPRNNNTLLLKICVEIVRNLACGEEVGREELIKQRTAEAVLYHARLRLSDVGFQEISMLAILNLVRVEDAGRWALVYDTKVHEYLKLILDEFPQNSRLQEMAAVACQLLSETYEPIREEMMVIGIHDSLQRVMTRHIDDASVVEEVASALKNFSLRSPERSSALIEAGVLTPFIKGLTIHAAHDGVQEEILGALIVLSMGSVASSCNSIISAGALGFVIQALRTFPYNPTVSCRGLLIIKNIAAAGHEFQDLLCSEEVRDAILLALQNNLHDEAVQDFGSQAIQHLCRGNARFQEMFLDVQLFPTLIHSLDIHSDEPGIVIEILRAWKIFANYEQAQIEAQQALAERLESLCMHYQDRPEVLSDILDASPLQQ